MVYIYIYIYIFWCIVIYSTSKNSCRWKNSSNSKAHGLGVPCQYKRGRENSALSWEFERREVLIPHWVEPIQKEVQRNPDLKKAWQMGRGFEHPSIGRGWERMWRMPKTRGKTILTQWVCWVTWVPFYRDINRLQFIDGSPTLKGKSTTIAEVRTLLAASWHVLSIRDEFIFR
jgi:hypothetical protein